MSRTTKKPDKEAEFLAGLELKMPIEQNWRVLVQNLQLSDSQELALRVCLQHVDQDLREYAAFRRSLPERSLAVRRLKGIAKAFGTLDAELKRAGKDLLHILPFDTRGFIGRSMSLRAMDAALGDTIRSTHADNQLSMAVVGGQRIKVRDVEDMSTPRREAIGLLEGDKLLIALTSGIHAPLKRWLDLDSQNTGGRSPDLRRAVIVYWLAHEAEDIIGRKATIAVTGPFVRLCEAMFDACGMPIAGLEKTIPKIVKRVRSDRKVRGKQSSVHVGILDGHPETDA